MKAGLTINTAPQGSDDWKAARVGVITASNFKLVRDKLKNGNPTAARMAYLYKLALERISGQEQGEVFQTHAMRQGVEQEPIARMAYEAMSGEIVEECGFITSPCGSLGYSPDGFIGGHGLIEIKTIISPAQVAKVFDFEHGTYCIDDYIDQCQFGLWLTGRDWLDLCLWIPALDSIGKGLHVQRIEADQINLKQLGDEANAFNHSVDQLAQKLSTAA